MEFGPLSGEHLAIVLHVDFFDRFQIRGGEPVDDVVPIHRLQLPFKVSRRGDRLFAHVVLTYVRSGFACDRRSILQKRNPRVATRDDRARQILRSRTGRNSAGSPTIAISRDGPT